MVVGQEGDQDGEVVRRKGSRRRRRGESEGVCGGPTHGLWSGLFIQYDPVVDLGTSEQRTHHRLRPHPHCPTHPGSTMLCQKVETSCVELSGRRRSNRPSLGGTTTVNNTEWFLLESLETT